MEYRPRLQDDELAFCLECRGAVLIEDPKMCGKTTLAEYQSKSVIKDPSVAVAAFGLNPEYYMTDLQSFGFIFESRCMRDLLVCSAKFDGKISYYHDRYKLEADCVHAGKQ